MVTVMLMMMMMVMVMVSYGDADADVAAQARSIPCGHRLWTRKMWRRSSDHLRIGWHTVNQTVQVPEKGSANEFRLRCLAANFSF
jgi:hypothetical protein